MECSICFDILDSRNEMTTKKTDTCVHAFHSDCLKEWLKVKNTCPNCRTEVSNKIYSDLHIPFPGCDTRSSNMMPSLNDILSDSSENAFPDIFTPVVEHQRVPTYRGRTVYGNGVSIYHFGSSESENTIQNMNEMID